MAALLDMKKIAEDLERYYRTAEQYAKRLESHDESAYAEYVSFVSRYAPKGALFLDAGCGTGLSSRMLNEAGYHVTGLDLSGINIDKARRGENEGLKFLQASALDMPFADNTFDAVGSFLFIEHIPDVARCLSEMIRVAKSGGLVMVLSPNLLSPFNQVYDLINVMFRKNGPTTFGERSALRIFGLLVKNTFSLLGKELSFRTRFIYREPVLENRFDYIPDNDAVYLSNPVDLRRYFKARGLRMVKYQGETFFGHILPDLVTGIHIVARKP